MKLLAYAAAALSMTIASVSADPIEDRQAIMKERGALMRILGPIAQGRADFDAATVLDALEKLDANAQATTDVAALWPEGTETGGDTEAAPTIWSDAEGFRTISEDYAAKTAAAVAAAPQDLAAFQAAFGPVASSCGTCHETYRLRQ